MHTNASFRHIASSNQARITGPKARASSRRSRRNFTAALSPAIESLESRRLLTGTLPTMTLEVIDNQANEAGNNDAIVRFTRTGGDITQPIHAAFDISAGGTATYLVDYFFANESSFSFGIAAGQTSADLIVRGKPDNLVEGDETVHFQLAANSAAYVVGSPNSGDVTIIDGPPAPTITLSVIDGLANEAGTDDAIVRFTRTGGDPTAPVNVQYANAGTAEYLTDYFYPNDSNHSVLIPVGQTTADLIVRGKPDNLIEGDETVHFSILPNPAYQLGTPDSADVTILDAVNKAPTGVDDLLTDIPEDSAPRTIPFATLLANDSAGANEAGQTLTLTAVNGPVGGTVAIVGTNVIFTPTSDYNGPAGFTYTLQDNGTTNGFPDPKSASANASFTITPVNDPPVADAGANKTASEASAVTFSDAAASDVDGDTLGYLWNFGDGASGSGPSPTHTYADNGVYIVSLTVSDGQGGSTSDTLQVTINNLAPTALPNAYTTPQATAATGNVITEDTGSGSDSDPAGVNDPLTVSGYTQPTNGSVVVTATGSFTYTPASTFSGIDTFTYTISDGDGGSATATVTITVGTAAPGGISTIPDTCLGGTALLIVGTSGNDDIHVSPGTTSSTLKVTVNGLTTTQPRPSGRVIVFAGTGDDTVQVAGAVTNSVWLYGEAGNDRLDAGNEAAGGNLLIGGDGNDDLSGGNGRDVLVGGQGADKIIGNANDDLLIAGGTSKDRKTDPGHEAFWCDVLVEWTSAHSFQNRVHNLTNDALSTEPGFNGVSFLNAATLRDDTSIDQIDMLNGSAGNDWFIYQSGEDKVVGESAVEQQYDTVLPNT